MCARENVNISGRRKIGESTARTYIITVRVVAKSICFLVEFACSGDMEMLAHSQY